MPPVPAVPDYYMVIALDIAPRFTTETKPEVYTSTQGHVVAATSEEEAVAKVATFMSAPRYMVQEVPTFPSP